MTADDKPRVEIKGRIFIGGYDLHDAPSGTVWLYGPEGDGMGMNQDTINKLHELIEKFFKEHM